MQCRARCVVGGLRKAPELNGKEGVALKLDSATGERYVVEIAGRRVKLKPENLTPVDHNEEADDGGMIIVNDLCYCSEHRMEVCGSCGFDFRMMNRMSQLGPDEPMETAERLAQREIDANAPPRRAPRAGQPLAQEVEPLRFTRDALPSKGLDPEQLRPWTGSMKDLESSFDNFSIPERMREMTSRPSPQEDPGFWLRINLLQLVRCITKAQKDNKSRLYMLQDSAQTQNLTIDVRAIHEAPSDPEDDADNDGEGAASLLREPVLSVRFLHGTVGSVTWLHASLMEMVREKGVKDFTECAREIRQGEVTTEEITALKQLLEKNATRLSRSYLEQAQQGQPRGVSISILQPLDVSADKAPPKKCCAMCGKETSSCKVRRFLCLRPSFRSRSLCTPRLTLSLPLVRVNM